MDIGSGTSIAVPILSSAAALVQATNPSLCRDEIVQILFEGSDILIS